MTELQEGERDAPASFRELGLSVPLLTALERVGYEAPSPIQAKAIPPLLAGRDLLGQAQTGTGKTAAFALPLLDRIDPGQRAPQVLVLTPTRELAIQVAEAFVSYASALEGFHVLPIYGGQDYAIQLRALKRGVHVVVGTPGRVMDHMRRGSLALDGLRALVLDEADEMLRMGFIDDVEWVLQRTPSSRQIALFSATMPGAIRRIAIDYLDAPVQATIAAKGSSVAAIRQRYWLVSGRHKLDALTRIMEVEPLDGVIIFVRTKTATVELAEKLEARGYATAPLNGDLNQKQREQTIDRLKRGRVDVVIATDVAARGLDVARISHVINYDIPHDPESYIHRIGRTGRAGRSGDAILFVAPRERRMLAAIERATRQRIERLVMPSVAEVNDRRVAAFKARISEALDAGGLEPFARMVEEYSSAHDVAPLDIAAALASLAQGDRPLLLEEEKRDRPSRKQAAPERARDTADRGRRAAAPAAVDTPPPASGTERFRLEVGAEHGVRPADIVGAIANETGLEGAMIGPIRIAGDHSLVDLPEGMPRTVFRALRQVWVCGRKLAISRCGDETPEPSRKTAARRRRVRPHRGDGVKSRRGGVQRKGAPRKRRD